MNTVAKRLITICVSLFLLAYVGYQAYLALYHPLRTERARSSTVQDVVSTTGFVLHNETPITASAGSGVIDYTRENGERVAKDGIIAQVYANAQDAENVAKLKTVNAQIARLQADGTSDQTAAVDLGSLDAEIGESFLTLADATGASRVTSIGDASGSFLDLLNREQLATGKAKDFSAQIAALQQQAADLQSKTGNVLKTITSPASGYFVSAVDGYESAYNVGNVLSVRAADVKKLETAKPAPAAGAVGKVVSEFQWYIVCTVSNDDVHKLKVGGSASVQFMLSSENEVPVTVAAINRDSDGCAVVLECDYMTSKLAVVRKQPIEIAANAFTGIRVDNRNIYIVGGKKGVYVLTGNAVRFKTIEPVYNGNGYTVSKIDSSDTSRLQVYDSVIVNGDDLYDGKIIK